MKSYSKYIEDTSFLDWIYSPTEELDAVWEAYMHENPVEKIKILELKEILLTIKTKDVELSKKEKNDILEKLLNKVDHPVKTVGFIKKYYRYAAVFLVLVALGVFFNNNFTKTNNPLFEDIKTTSLETLTETQLVFETGKPIVINKKESKIEYTQLGAVIVNDTLSNHKTNKKEALETLNKLLVPYGKRSKITLSDGSTVHLNAGTEFVFPEKFISKQRTVFLSGEAFFEVAANKERPFVVKTIDEKLSVEVLGTKFNISAYPTDAHILTTLKEGKVDVVKKGLLSNKKTTLRPGQLASWNKSKEHIEVKQVNIDNYTLWTLGLLHFESESIFNVIRKIERFYNIKIIFHKDLKAYNTNISGKLDLNDKIEKTLENLMLITKLKLELTDTDTYILK